MFDFDCKFLRVTFCTCWSSLADNSARKTCSCAFTEAVSASDLVVDGSMGSQACSNGNAYIVLASHVLAYQKPISHLLSRSTVVVCKKTTLGTGCIHSHSPTWIGSAEVVRWFAEMICNTTDIPIYLCRTQVTLSLMIDLQFEVPKGGNHSNKAFLRLGSRVTPDSVRVHST